MEARRATLLEFHVALDPALVLRGEVGGSWRPPTSRHGLNRHIYTCWKAGNQGAEPRATWPIIAVKGHVALDQLWCCRTPSCQQS